MPRIVRTTKLKELNQITDAFERALNFEITDPDVSLIQARKCAECICKLICLKKRVDTGGKPSKKMMLDELINILRHKAILSDQVYYSLLAIQNFGNFATHDQGEENQELTSDSVRAGLHALANLVNWYVSRYLKTHVDYDIVAASRVEMPHTVVNDHIRVLQFISAVIGKEIELIEENIETQVARTICKKTTALLKTMPDLEQKILIMAFGLENSIKLSIGTIALSLKMPHRLIHHQLLVSMRRLKHPARIKVLKKIMDLVEQY